MPLSKSKLLSASAIYTFGDFLVLGVSGFLLLPVYVRYMTPAEYGLYGTVTTMMSMLGIVMMMGFHSATGRFYFIYKETGEEKAYLGSLWLFQSIVAIGLAFVFILLGKPLWRLIAPDVPTDPYIWVVIAGALLAFASGIYSIWLRVEERPWPFMALQLFNTFVFVVLILWFLVGMQGGSLGALCAAVGASLSMALISFVKLGRKINWKIHPKYLKNSLTFGGWMMIGTIGSVVLNRSQLFVLQNYADLAMVGILNLGLQLSSVIVVVSVSFGKAWQPFIYSSANKEIAAMAIARSAKYYVAVMMYASLAIFVLSNEIIGILARPTYAGAVPIIRLLSAAMFMSTLGLFPSSALLYERRAGLTQLVGLGFALVNLFLTILLVKLWQINGAAWSMLISSIVLVSTSHVLSQRILRVNYRWAELFRIFGLGCAIGLVEGVVTPTLIVPYATVLRLLLLLLFPVGLVGLGVFRKEEVLSLWSTVKSHLQRLRVV